MLVQLLYHLGCPHVAAARAALQRALDELSDAPGVVELDLNDARTPAHLRVWGSPTILVDGKDVAGGAPSGPSCRLYPGSGDPGAPPAALITAALRRAAGDGAPPTPSSPTPA
jgi:hypothetical protein